MIHVIGVKRLVVLAVLVCLNAGLLYGLYQQILPEEEALERQVRSARSQVGTTQADVDRLLVEFDQLGEQQAGYEQLKRDDFFSVQSRQDAENLFLRAEEESGVVSAYVSIGSGKKVENEVADNADHVVLTSEINLKLEAMDDLDLYKYIEIVHQNFPGHLSFDEVFVQRTGPLNDVILRGIASGQKPALVKANASMTWRTMIKKDGLDNQASGGY